ncbi:YceI family protein [Chitinophaga sancti]|uniref:YceI family protein n=1 Tax=Chitinophaga sancti TaxID=1004 RepID=A0A1K1SEW3_9BACT|nr:YceI family protein [Chitinophaga sancti]WQD59994.1 YceI family protein [Chitinophaga sancti]WQG87876.1 YceI family protein [Chitinophaga sancti]SFW82652.1 YceI-like domain-containing protein [Chitinophaga sancti]
MKNCIVLLTTMLLLQLRTLAQDIYSCKNTSLSFFSATPMEDIDAVTNKAVSAINGKTGAVYFKVTINTFKFKKSLMEEHFNENYLESDKYPTAEFKGKILEVPDLHKDGTYPVIVEGTMNMHGVDKVYHEKGTITVKDGKPSLDAKFNVKLVDHKIKVPTLVVKNIAEVIEVTVKGAYLPAS